MVTHGGTGVGDVRRVASSAAIVEAIARGIRRR
jgi:hypothetical protein